METVIKNPKCRIGRTILKKYRRLGSVFACMAVIALVSGLPKGHTIPAKHPKVCLTPICIRTALNVMEKMKSDLDPCGDFYEFACGGYVEKTEIPTHDVLVNIFFTTMGKLLLQLHDIIREERSEADPKYFEFPHALYKACMDIKSIEKWGAKPIQQILKKLGWPVTDCDCRDFEKTWTWPDAAKKFRDDGVGFNYILSLSVDVDKKNDTRHIITLGQPSTALYRGFLVYGIDHPFVAAYYKLLVSIAVRLGADKKTAEKELKKSVQFEIDLAKISKASEDSDDNYNLFSIKELQELYPFIHWHKYINNIMPAGLTVDENEIVNLSGRTFFEDLGKLLNRTNKRVIANYVMGAVLFFSSDFLSDEFRQRKLQYSMSGQQKQMARYKTCVDTVLKSFPISMAALYVRKHFTEKSKKIAFEMFTKIRNAFDEILDKSEWMDSETKEEAKRKLKLMTPHIGYPAEMMNNTLLEGYYRNLEMIDPAKYFKAILKINHFETDLSFNKLRLPVKKNHWLSLESPIEVNGYYSLKDNSMEITAGLCQGQLFDSQQPQFMNFAGLGFIMGHEVTHGFDSIGRNYNADGNSVNWWKGDTEKRYLKQVQCLIEQYGNYTDKQTGLNLNGKKTQNENVADNGGIKATYMAYRKWVSEHGVEPQLPGLNYTSLQTFWIAYAQMHCSKYQTEALKRVIAYSVHVPFKYRPLGTLQNMPEFSTDFGCLAGAPMNPVEKCKVW